MPLNTKRALAILMGLSLFPMGYIFSKYDVSPWIGLPIAAVYVFGSAWLIARSKSK